ncbi:MAG: hypothetical protein K6U08_10360 [Firmicutes bacterium]|nr:hypothetical protein [Bacillota bacterium]
MAASRSGGTPGHRRLLYGFAALAAFVLLAFLAARALTLPQLGDWSAALWRLLGVRTQPVPPQAEGGPAALPDQGVGGQQPAASPVVVGPDAVFVWSVVYKSCGCTQVIAQGKAASGQVGLDRSALARLIPDWEIVTFSPTLVEARRADFTSMCPRHSKRTLRLEEGRVMLYAGSVQDPDVRLILIGPTEVTEDDLSPEEAAILREGRAFANQEQAVRYLEGLGD